MQSHTPTNEKNWEADRLKILRPSGIRKMFERAQGIEGVISLGIGAPDVTPPNGLIDALKIQTDNPVAHKYSLNSGIIPLREKIADRYKERYGFDYDSKNVLISTGGTEFMFAALMALLNPKDEILIPDPGFVYYPSMPKIFGAVPVPLNLDDNFQINIDDLVEKLTPKTKGLIMNSPGNPTGAVYSREIVKQISEIAVDNNLFILSDEVYEYMIFQGYEHHSFAEFAPENTIILNSFSKSYCVPGWRIGFGLAPNQFMHSISKLHPFIVANTNTLYQFAINEFFGTTEEQAYFSKVSKIMEDRNEVTYEAFNKIPSVSLNKSHGSFYSFPKVSDSISTNPGEVYVERAFKEAKVVLVPGSEFGDSRNDHFRISYGSASTEEIKEAAERLIAIS